MIYPAFTGMYRLPVAANSTGLQLQPGNKVQQNGTGIFTG